MFYVIPSNEDVGLKELRVSTRGYNPLMGLLSGVKYLGKPIEDAAFNTSNDAYNAIMESAPHLQA